MSTALILDTETTDVENCEVIELAYVPIYEDLPDGQAFLRRYKPVGQIKWGALATHHILPSDLEHAAQSASAAADVPAADYWIGHNIDFDWRALKQPPIKRICTLALSRWMWPELDSHSLSAVSYFIHGANTATRQRVQNAHSALHDVLLCQSIVKLVMSINKISTFDRLYELSEDARIPRTWTFGKFKGQPIEAADRGYANWCRKQPDFDPYVLEALRRKGL